MAKVGPSRTTIDQAQLTERLRASPSKVWAYIRVSTEKQEDGQTYDMQKADIVTFCTENSLDDPQFVHEAASAKNPAIPIAVPTMMATAAPVEISPRPLLLMLLGFLCDRPGSHLVVWKLDRLARLAYEQELMFDMLARKHVRVHSTQRGEQEVLDRGKDDGDPARVMFRQVLASVAQYERRMIEIRMKTGLRMKASKGEYVGGAPPFGYTSIGKELVINPAEVETVRRVFFLRERCGETYDRIAQILANKFKTPGWHKVRVSRVLHNKQIYEGIYVDPFDVAHDRPDLRMLPTASGWDEWMQANNLFADSMEGLNTYVEPTP